MNKTYRIDNFEKFLDEFFNDYFGKQEIPDYLKLVHVIKGWSTEIKTDKSMDELEQLTKGVNLFIPHKGRYMVFVEDEKRCGVYKVFIYCDFITSMLQLRKDLKAITNRYLTIEGLKLFPEDFVTLEKRANKIKYFNSYYEFYQRDYVDTIPQNQLEKHLKKQVKKCVDDFGSPLNEPISEFFLEDITIQEIEKLLKSYNFKKGFIRIISLSEKRHKIQMFYTIEYTQLSELTPDIYGFSYEHGKHLYNVFLKK